LKTIFELKKPGLKSKIPFLVNGWNESEFGCNSHKNQIWSSYQNSFDQVIEILLISLSLLRFLKHRPLPNQCILFEMLSIVLYFFKARGLIIFRFTKHLIYQKVLSNFLIYTDTDFMIIGSLLLSSSIFLWRTFSIASWAFPFNPLCT